jgi:hypothetical protein
MGPVSLGGGGAGPSLFGHFREPRAVALTPSMRACEEGDMFRLAPTALGRLSPEAADLAERFLFALSPAVRALVNEVRLFGAQARRYDPGAPFSLLVVVEEPSLSVKTAVSIARQAATGDGAVEVEVTMATPTELDLSTGLQGRLFQNARREGVELWRRAA